MADQSILYVNKHQREHTYFEATDEQTYST